VETVVASETLDLPVPRFLLQPLVENAVRHGLGERTDAGSLRIEAALRFARRSRSPLTLLLTAAAASERETLAAAATELAAGAGVSLHAILSAAEPTLATILRVAQGARLLVLPQHETPADSTFMTTLVAQMRVPLLVVGARERT
jgi:hypothetical protein